VCADDKKAIFPITANLIPLGRWLERRCPVQGHRFWVRYGESTGGIDTDDSAAKPTD
jgi:hypothetical protein